MSQNENKPENNQDQVNPEVTEQDTNLEQAHAENEAVDVNTADTEAEVNTANTVEAESRQILAAQNSAPAQVNASSTGWKIATGILAAAVIGLLIYTFIPKETSSVIAKVNGDKVTQSDVLDKLVQYNYSYVETLVDAIIDEKLIAQELAAKNLTVTDADLDAEIAAFRLKYPDDNDYLSLLSYYGMTEDDMKNNLKQSSQVRLLLSDTVTVTDEQIQEYFDTNYDSFGAHEERVRASHILVADEEVAKDIISQLDQGADFATLAAQYGTDGSAQNGGDLGYFEFGEMIPEFSTAAFALETNTYSKEPVASQYGYHVILKTDEQAAYTPSLDNLKEAIKIELINSEIYNQNPTYLEDLRTKGTVSNEYTTIYENYAGTVQ